MNLYLCGECGNIQEGREQSCKKCGSRQVDELDYPDLPDDPRESLPTMEGDCDVCGESEYIFYSKQVGKYEDRVDRWCSGCLNHRQTDISYYGPEPTARQRGLR